MVRRVSNRLEFVSIFENGFSPFAHFSLGWFAAVDDQKKLSRNISQRAESEASRTRPLKAEKSLTLLPAAIADERLVFPLGLGKGF